MLPTVGNSESRRTFKGMGTVLVASTIVGVGLSLLVRDLALAISTPIVNTLLFYFLPAFPRTFRSVAIQAGIFWLCGIVVEHFTPFLNPPP